MPFLRNNWVAVNQLLSCFPSKWRDEDNLITKFPSQTKSDMRDALIEIAANSYIAPAPTTLFYFAHY